MSSSFDLVRVMRDVADSLAEPEDLDQTLWGITKAAQQVITGVDHASISVLCVDGTLETVAPTDLVVQRSDALQYQYGQGPCVMAAKTGEDVDARQVATDDRWPSYGPRVSELGVVSQWAFALRNDGRTWGALNLYSMGDDSFDEVSRETAALFATSASVAHGLAHKVRTLTTAIESRTIIGKAVGIVMSSYGLDDNRAFSFLIRASQTGNTKLRKVAREIVERANEDAASIKGQQ